LNQPCLPTYHLSKIHFNIILPPTTGYFGVNNMQLKHLHMISSMCMDFPRSYIVWRNGMEVSKMNWFHIFNVYEWSDCPNHRVCGI
jgi:hypothetical protein